MDCPYCEKRYLNESDHTKEECEELQTPLTDQEFKDMCERVFLLEIEQGNYGKKFNDGFRKIQNIIKENIKE